MYYLLTESFKEQEAELRQIILEAVPAEAIYLLSSTLVTRRTESVFMPDAPSCRQLGQYHVLVLVSEGNDVNVVQDTIENRCRNWLPVTAMVLKGSVFHTWLQEGHRFAHTVCKRAFLLHGEKPPASAYSQPPGEEIAQQQNKELLTEGTNKITEFLAGADLFLLRKQTNMAAFMLHQAAEQALHTMFHITTGMYLNTHSIDKLLRYCAMVCYRLPGIFPRNNEKDERLFRLLQKAYTGGRYDSDYSIGMQELEVIKKRVKKLKNLLDRL